MTGKPEEKKEQHNKVRLALAAMLVVLCAVLPASAINIDNFSAINIVLTNVTGVILPQLLNLVIGALPIIVVLLVCVLQGVPQARERLSGSFWRSSTKSSE